ncbi:MAG: hypothetical protein M3Z10_07910 [Gemmatimonadota bacterium]|nr:hypothetical protein [Gemmatimonadota bacterium]
MFARRAPLLLLVAAAWACASLPIIGRRPPEFWGFVAPWDATSPRSAVAHARSLRAVVTGWLALDTLTGMPVPLYADTLARALPAGTMRFALVTSFLVDSFRTETIRRLYADSIALARSAGAVAAHSAQLGYRGVILDFEGMSPRDLPALLGVARAIHDSAHARGVDDVVMAVPASDTAAYPGRPLLSSVDGLVVMLYDEHWAGSPPGAIASPTWARRVLNIRVSEVGAANIVASLPLYGYFWKTGAAGEAIGYPEAQRRAAEASAPLEREPSTATLRASNPNDWQIWVSDAVLVDSLVSDASRIGVRRFALWRLGLEDPDLWTSVVKP